jgi:hypothetical protein
MDVLVIFNLGCYDKYDFIVTEVKVSKTIELVFDGYYLESELPPSGHDCSGVYAVYRGNTSNLTELLYVGRSENIAERPGSSHHKYEDWRNARRPGEKLYFSFADTSDEERAEAALIYQLKPRLNDTGTEGFHHPETTIKTSGKNAGIGAFTVPNTDN